MAIELLNMDCMDYMREQPDKSFDLAIVDPPYGIGDGFKYRGSGGKRQFYREDKLKNTDWDVPPNEDYFVELFRVSNHQIIWGGNYFNLPQSRKPLCWDKMRPNQKNLSEWEYAWTSFDGRAQMFSHCGNGGFVGGKRIHPTQKPIKLYKWLLKNFTEPGQRILDTHLGSGSSAIAAHYFCCDFIGIEIDEDYYNAALNRFNNETRQIALI